MQDVRKAIAVEFGAPSTGGIVDSSKLGPFDQLLAITTRSRPPIPLLHLNYIGLSAPVKPNTNSPMGASVLPSRPHTLPLDLPSSQTSATRKDSCTPSIAGSSESYC